MIVRLDRKKGSVLILTVDHVIHQREERKSDWIQLFGLPTGRNMDDSFTCDSLKCVHVYDHGRLIWSKAFPLVEADIHAIGAP